jgi:hypothetical protein
MLLLCANCMVCARLNAPCEYGIPRNAGMGRIPILIKENMCEVWTVAVCRCSLPVRIDISRAADGALNLEVGALVNPPIPNPPSTSKAPK